MRDERSRRRRRRRRDPGDRVRGRAATTPRAGNGVVITGRDAGQGRRPRSSRSRATSAGWSSTWRSRTASRPPWPTSVRFATSCSPPSTATRTRSRTTTSTRRCTSRRSSSSATPRSSTRCCRGFGDDTSLVLFGGMAKERPYPGSTTVSTVNGGIVGLTRTLVEELEPLRVNSIHPGVVGDSPYWSEKPAAVAKYTSETPTGPARDDERDRRPRSCSCSRTQRSTASSSSSTAAGTAARAARPRVVQSPEIRSRPV